MSDSDCLSGGECKIYDYNPRPRFSRPGRPTGNSRARMGARRWGCVIPAAERGR